MDERTRYWLLQLFEQASADKWFGTLEFGIRNGEIFLCRKEETIHPPAAEANSRRQQAAARV